LSSKSSSLASKQIHLRMVLECLRIMWKGVVVARLVAVVLINASFLVPAALPSTLPRLSLLQGPPPPLLIFWVIVVVVAASEGARRNGGSLVCNDTRPLLLE
jgi:hypothetical protein